MTSVSGWVRLVAAALLAGVMLVALPDTARASCADPSQTPPSPHVFVGVVVSTSSLGRIAVVRTDAGEEVIVRGTMANADNEATSVDRAYVVGGRYEFHPLNKVSVFDDNACTGTLLLGMVAVDQPGRAQAGWWVLVAGVMAVLVAALAVRLVRRSRGESGAASTRV